MKITFPKAGSDEFAQTRIKLEPGDSLWIEGKRATVTVTDHHLDFTNVHVMPQSTKGNASYWCEKHNTTINEFQPDERKPQVERRSLPNLGRAARKD
jgi:hypothetical protein